jgi:hypothetical protein
MAHEGPSRFGSASPRRASAEKSSASPQASRASDALSPLGPTQEAFLLQHTWGNQALMAAAGDSPAGKPVVNRQAELELIVGHTRAAVAGRVSAPDVHLQRAPTPLLRSTGPVIQRFVMTEKQWHDKSALFGKMRSLELLKIDDALAKYNAANNQAPARRMPLLLDLRAAIDAWRLKEQVKGKGEIKNKRLPAITKLLEAVQEEQKAIGEQMVGQQAPAGPAQVVEAAQEIYTRAIHELHKFIALAVIPKNAERVLGEWRVFRIEAKTLHMSATKLVGQQGQQDQQPNATDANDVTNAIAAAEAVREGMRAFRTIAYRYLHAKRDDSKKSEASRKKVDLTEINTRMKALLNRVVLPAGNADAVFGLLTMVQGDIGAFAEMTGANKGGSQQGKGKLKEIEGEDSEDWDLIESVLNANDQLTGILGYHAGTGNEGMQDFYATPSAFGTEDTRSQGQKIVADIFSLMDPGRGMNKLDPDDPDNKGKIANMAANRDYMLGAADLGAALGGLGSEALTIYKAVKTLNDPKADAFDKANARMTLITIGLPTILNTYKAAGAVLTMIRGSNIASSGDSSGGGLAPSAFGFTASGTDISTDVKLVGDFAGAVASVMATIMQVVDYFKWIKTAAQDPKVSQGGWRKDLELAGNMLTKSTGIVSSVASNFKAVAKLGYQIAEGGQATSDASATVSNLGGAVPAIQLIFGVMQAIQLTYKLVRLGLRRGSLTDSMKLLTAKGARGDLKHVEAVELAHETLVKRMNRVGISLGHALSAVVAGGLNASGMGAAPGMAITLSSMLLKIGQIALRKGKQFGRDHSAKKHEKQGDSKSYAEWKRGKQIAAAEEGKWSRFKAAVEIKFTFNWDKSSENKGSTTREVALEILRMNDKDIYKALGVWQAIQAVDKKAAKAPANAKTDKAGDKLAIIVAALNKRD